MSKARFFNLRMMALAAGLLVASLVGGIVGSYVTAKSGGTFFGSKPPGSFPSLVTGSTIPPADPAVLNTGFSSVAKAVLPGVVNISTSKVTRTASNSFFDDPIFRDFFGGKAPSNTPREHREQSLGSGVIVSPDGYILTNNHVIDGSTDIKVSLYDKRELKARLVGSDPKTDIAVLKIEAQGLPALALGDVSKVQVGDIVLAIGNPFGIGQTVTMGIVSATGRGNLNIEAYEDFIQTDAAINPGNSGGALINTRGEVIGINTAILSHGASGNQGIGFAVPVNMARQVFEQLVKNGKVVRGYLGIFPQDVSATTAKAFGLKTSSGALVGNVFPDSPAARAGLRTGDVITELNGQPILDSRDLRLKISQTAPGTRVTLKIVRDGAEREVPVTLVELPPDQRQPEATNDEGSLQGSVLEGVEVQELTPQIISQLRLPDQIRGIVVRSVAQGSAAQEAGLQRGDVIQEVNRKPVSTIADFNRLVKQSGNGSVLLLVNRGGTTLFLAIEQ